MTRVLLVNLASLPIPGNEPIFPIGARCVEDALRSDGHEVKLLDFVEAPAEYDALTDFDGVPWDVVGFAIRNIDPIDLACDGHVDAYAAFVQRIRQRVGTRPVFVGGGPGFSLFADTLVGRLGLDVGVRGPGEEAMLDIVRDPAAYSNARKVIAGRRCERFVTNVMIHPQSLMHAYAADGLASIGVETRRKTCFQRCVYCPYAYISGQNGGDLKPLELLHHEIAGIHKAGFRRIFFTDGIFNSQIAFAKQVVRMLCDEGWPGLSWSAYFTPMPFDDEFASLLKGSGIESVVVSPDSLDSALMVRLGKNFDLRAMNCFLKQCRQSGLRPMVNVVFGSPGETRETVRNTAAYINTMLRDDELSLHVGYRILPHTALSQETGLGADDLLSPTFYPFDDQLFQWLMQDLEPRFLPPSRMMHLLAGRASMRRMAKIESATAARLNTSMATERSFVALSRIAVRTQAV